ncbi:MAG: Carboxylic ester hydrolase [Alphaproteobacteria bacterium]|nr:Carboxylic ester hydrolase [Alphaproteobacteria bacterium]
MKCTILALLMAMTIAAVAAPIATAEGPVEGVARNGVTQFLGVPYAAPPVGVLRWMPPQPVTQWNAVRQARAFGPTCAQITTLGPFAGPPNSNEDCLYLNVFTPTAARKLPVLVWIHGGGYVDGESNDYDATRLAARGKLVIVTINYRLNLFGFLAHPALGGSGNYGILDMQAALKWVKRNIAAFGGDPGNVTLGGQSAGAGATAANMVSPGARGLFHRAIFQSGGYTPFATKVVAEERARKFAAAAGCGAAGNVAQCLRALPAAKIVALAGTPQANSPFINGPLVDGQVIPRQTIDAVTSGAFNAVPVMIGTTRDEGNFFNGIVQYFKPNRAAITESDYRDYLKAYGGNAGPGGSPPTYAKNTVGAVLAHYPPRPQSAQMAWDRAHSDMLACRGQYLSGALSARVPVYNYLFDDPTAPSYFPKMTGYESLAYHTSDIGYVFTGYHGGPEGLPTTLTPAQRKLSDRLIDAWASFARSGNPNGKSDAPWPRWKKDGTATFIQDGGWNRIQTHPQFAAAHQCAFWQSILLYK